MFDQLDGSISYLTKQPKEMETIIILKVLVTISKIEPADSPAYAYVLYTGPEFESEKDRKIRENNKMSAEEAVQAVINQENFDDYPQLIVEHDHDEDDRYVIHVYEIVREGTEDAHTATWGWYYVDPYSGDITSMF